MRVLLPLSEATVKEIMHQVAARGEPERIREHEGRLAVDLTGVVVVAFPGKMIKEN